jgi:WD40 repeat protein
MCLADDGRHVLVNVSSDSRPEVHLWDLEEQAIVQRFRGHRQARYVIRSCFGGIRNSFVICGSEDSLVYVWHMSSGALVAKLGGEKPAHSTWHAMHFCHLESQHVLHVSRSDMSIQF